ncbi:atrial natriuretic peptide-converting enzyme [Labrus bergylta]|uniref:atrial natriuretic peptide-converting enzyme n=1 Tax=Labrus bergylta TaxID=56723 RepID=UPI0009B31EA2|nr:atrial natriuretic peptide-converting enzyme-like [Labrus bergylta]
MKRLLLVVLSLLLSLQRARGINRNCKPVTSPFCQGLGYSTTASPTGVAGYSLQQIGQLVETACSPHIAILMCRVAVPECGSEDVNRMKPCRALCQKVKTDCESTFKARRLSWPVRLRCESLPENDCAQGQVSQAAPEAPAAAAATCETITVPLCKDLPYTETIMPNLIGHKSQVEAGLDMQQFSSLVRVGCSPQLKPFLCSLFAPECEAGEARPPCRTLCEQARSGCESLMNKFEVQWPESFQCDKFTTESCERRPAFILPTIPSGVCQKISVPLCIGLPYTETVLPNLLGHVHQRDVDQAIQTFASLVQVECSPHLKPFLCSVFTPECQSGRPRPPCRTLCEQARFSCEPLMNRFGLRWPETLKCERFTTESCEHFGVGSNGRICEPITIPVCQGLSYNLTITPNLLGHASQRDAVMKMSFFNSFVQKLCSVDIRLFLCTVYAPKCVAGEVQKPCKSFCERAKRGCEDLMHSFGVSWPEELQCNAFPEEMCISEDSRPDVLTAEDVVAKLIAAGYSVRGQSLTLRTAHLLVTLMDADKTEDLDSVEVFKMEHYVAVVRREYVESYESRNPPSVTQTQLKKALSAREFNIGEETFRTLWRDHRTENGIEYDDFVAVIIKLQILTERFESQLLNLPCDCKVASFSFRQFIRSAIF